MDSAELYMMLIRPSMVPIIGEAWTIPFNLQVELATWGWKISNSDEIRKASRKEAAFNERKGKLDTREKALTAVPLQRQLAEKMARFDVDAIIKRAQAEPDKEKRAKIMAEIGEKKEEQDAFVKKKLGEFNDDLQKKQSLGRTREEEAAKAREKEGQSEQDQVDDAMTQNFQFRFSKRVDFASTQMLNSMKQGDVFPTGIITVFQRAPNLNHAASLILTVQKLRLLDYKLRCEVSDTMTDMREDWVAEFTTLNYVYKGRGMIKKESGAQLVTAAVTQGTPRVFSMSLKFGSPI